MRVLILALILLPSLAAAQPAADKHAALEKLLDTLHTAPTEQLAGALEQRIEQAWLHASTPAVTLLMSRGLHNLQAKQTAEAEAAFSDAIVLDPALAEAWHRRAIARLLNGDTPGALLDLQETLRLEPRHFGAWRTLEQMAERREDWKAAWNAWDHLLDIDPRTPHGQEKAKDLKRRAFGDDT